MIRPVLAALVASTAIASMAHAQSIPTMARPVTLAGPQGLNQAMALKADATNGTLTSPAIDGGSLNGTAIVNISVSGQNPSLQWVDSTLSDDTSRWQVMSYQGQFQLNAVNDANTANNNAFTCSRTGYAVSGCSFTAPLTTSAGTFGGPATGDVIGLWPNLTFAPSPTMSGTLTITNAALPTLNLKSTSASTAAAIYQGSDGALNLQPNNSGSNTNVYQAGGSFYVHDSTGSAVVNMLANGQSVPFSIWQDTQGNGWVSPSADNADLTLVAKGNGTLYLNGNAVELNNPFLSDPTKCGSITGATGCLEIKNDGGALGYVPWFPAN